MHQGRGRRSGIRESVERGVNEVGQDGTGRVLLIGSRTPCRSTNPTQSFSTLC